MKFAKLEITLELNEDQIAELKEKGYTDLHIQKAIERSITLTESNVRQPVQDMVSVVITGYEDTEE